MATLSLRGPDKSVDHLIEVLQHSKQQCTIIQNIAASISCLESSQGSQISSAWSSQGSQISSAWSSQGSQSSSAWSSTAGTLIQAFQNWENVGSCLIKSSANSRKGGGNRSLQLPMSSATTLEQVNLNLSLERIRTDIKLRIVLRKAEVSREYWMLEALIVILEHFISSKRKQNSKVITENNTNLSQNKIKNNEIIPKESTIAEIKKEDFNKESIKQNQDFKSNGNNVSMKTKNSEEKDNIKQKNLVGWRKVLAELETTHGSNRPQATEHSTSSIRTKYNLDGACLVALTIKERKKLADKLESGYLSVIPADRRVLPGLQGTHSKWDRQRLGIDCDEVYPGIVLGNAATVKNKQYLKSLGITHVLNAAENRGVNTNQDYYAENRGVNTNQDYYHKQIKYKGIRVEDTPHTLIHRHFLDVVEFMDEALSSEGGKIFVNCVFGKSRSATCVAAFLILKLDWSAVQALQHIRKQRNIQVNSGFVQQLADLQYKLEIQRNNK